MPQDGGGSRLFFDAEHLDAPHSPTEVENVLASRARGDDGEQGAAGFHVR